MSDSNIELLTDFTVHVRAERGLRANTVSAYLGDLRQYAEVLEQRHVTLFTADCADVTAWVEHLESHQVDKRSRSRKIAALRSFYKWLILQERLDKDPMRRLPLPKPAKLLPKPVELKTITEILDRAGTRASADDATAYEIRDYAILEVIYGGGLRVSEACALRPADISRESGMATVRGKGDKERLVPLGDAAVAAVEHYTRVARPQLVKHKPDLKKRDKMKALFLSQQGTQITRQWVHEIVSTAGGAGTDHDEHVHPHRLRHSCGTHLLNAGANLRDIQEQLGHASLATTQIYTQVSKGHLQDSHARFHPRGRA